jgi:hypothetical protein
MLHYFTTGAHKHVAKSAPASMTGIAAKKKSSSLLVDCHRMEKQLPNVQELFAEAFVELQKEIDEESARAFQSVATAEDPLAILLGSTASSRDANLSRPLQKSYQGGNNKQLHPKQNSAKGDLEGGFIREAVLPERLRKLHNPPKHDGFASAKNSFSVPTAAQRKRSSSKLDATTIDQQLPTRNPYQRKPPTNIWNQIVDSNDGTSRKERSKMKWEEIEKEMTRNITSGNTASSIKCRACGSTDVEISGNVTSRNNDMMKGEVWGMKDRAEIVIERCRCVACGKVWNDEGG